MDQASSTASSARRNEDIALDLLKFVVTTAGVGRTTGSATGFGAAASTKPEDQVAQILALYTRCLNVVEGKGETR